MPLIEFPEKYKKFITLRSNPICKAGQWWIGEAHWEPLYRARIEGGPRGSRIIQTSLVGVPFETLAPFIVELGFHLTKEDLERLGGRPIAPVLESVKMTEKLERDYGDLIDEKVQSNLESSEPSYKKSAGIIVPRGFKKNDSRDKSSE